MTAATSFPRKHPPYLQAGLACGSLVCDLSIKSLQGCSSRHGAQRGPSRCSLWPGASWSPNHNFPPQSWQCSRQAWPVHTDSQPQLSWTHRGLPSQGDGLGLVSSHVPGSRPRHLPHPPLAGGPHCPRCACVPCLALSLAVEFFLLRLQPPN